MIISCFKCNDFFKIEDKKELYIDEKKYGDLWKEIIHATEFIKLDYYREGLTLSYNNIINVLTDPNSGGKFKIYNEEKDLTNNNDLRGELYVTSNEIIFKLWKSDVLKTSNVYVIHRNYNNGNCVDDFIKRGVKPLISSINDFTQNIESRINNRTNVIDYHQTNCYELDFTQISLIKTLCQKIIDNCNKQLEGMSEKYTKI